jgi:ABC-type uncharacterized transport system auxiliary subunit
MKKLRLKLKGILIITTIFGVSACSSILPQPKPAPTVYRLSIPANSTPSEVKESIVVNIEFPQASRALSGTDIVLSPDGRRLTAAAGASWSEPVPNQIRNVLIETLGKYKKVTGVIPKGGTRAPYRLNMQIHRFEAEFDNSGEGAPDAIVQIYVTLTDTNTRRLVGVHSVNTSARAYKKTVSSIVEAQDIATREAMVDISTWLDDLLTGED